MTDWHPEEVKSAVRMRGTTLAQLAREAGLPKQLLSMCLQARVSEKGDQVIAAFLGKQPHEIWPSRYNKRGARIRLRALSEAGSKAA